MAVRVDEIGGAEEALKSTVNSGVAEDLVQVRDFGEDIVTGIAFGGEEGFNLAVDILVYRGRVSGLHGDIAVGQVGLDLGVGQEDGCGHEAGLFAVEKDQGAGKE